MRLRFGNLTPSPILPNLLFDPNLNFLVFPLIAFILGRNALIFQNRFRVTLFFRNIAIRDGELTPSRHKKD